MKKLFLVLFLSAGATTFASTGKIATPVKNKSVKKTEKVVKWSCSVGEFTVSSAQTSDPCSLARAFYCGAHKCSQATLDSLG